MIFKLHNIESYCEWLTDPGVVVSGSADPAVKGRHFHKDMRINKELFYALIKHKVEILISRYEEFKIYF